LRNGNGSTVSQRKHGDFTTRNLGQERGQITWLLSACFDPACFGWEVQVVQHGATKKQKV
jgi:hypothetical protein